MSQRDPSKRARLRLRGWVGQFGADLKASLDPGLLRVFRFFGFIYGPIDRRLPIDEALRKAGRRRLAPHVGWRHSLGGITYLLFLVLVLTGVLLALYYRPSADEAYASMQQIVSQVRLGWLVRDLHVWSANLIVISLLAHMGRVFFTGAYQPPRETSWFVGLLLLFLVLAFGATGYLLPWDQWAYWTVTEALNTLRAAPIFGGFLADVLTGDTVVSGATLSRFFAIHVIILPWLVLGLLVLHFSMVRRHGPAPPAGGAPVGEGVPFYPHHLLRSFMVSVLVLGVVVTLATLYPRPVGDPATPFQLPDELVSTWLMVEVTRALLHYVGPWGLALVSLLGIGLALFPLFDRSGERRLRKRPVAVALASAFFLAIMVAWLAGRQLRAPVSPDLLRPASEGVVPVEGGVPVPAPGPEPVRPAPPPSAEPGR